MNRKANLKVVLITQGLSRVVIPICNSPYNVVGIIEDAPRGYKKGLKNNLKRLYFTLNSKKSLKSFCRKTQTPYFFLKKNGENELREWLVGLQVDLIVVYGMSKLLRPIIYELPKYGTINLHPSILPEHPGRNPWFWTYVNVDLNPGVTLHFIDEGMDTGDVIFQERYKMNLGDTSPKMQDIAIGEVGVKLIIKALKELSEKGILPRKRHEKSKVYPIAYQVGETENVINWKTWSVQRIWHLLRGTELWYKPIEQPMGIYKFHRWEVLLYDTSNIVNTEDVGKVIKSKNKFYLICRDGIIYLKPRFSSINFLTTIFK